MKPVTMYSTAMMGTSQLVTDAIRCTPPNTMSAVRMASATPNSAFHHIASEPVDSVMASTMELD